MAIDFSLDRSARLIENNRLWWRGELDRPLIGVILVGAESPREPPKLPKLRSEDIPEFHQTYSYGLSVRPEQIVDEWDYDLSCHRFLGDAFPYVFTNFGTSFLAALLGAELIVRPKEGTVWLKPEDRPISKLHFEYHSDNIWFNRVKGILKAAVERWEGLVRIAWPDLGGIFDIMSAFRPGSLLPVDLYDHPDEVKRLTWEFHDLWFKYFDEFNEVLRPANQGYLTWAGTFSQNRHAMLQSDFSYMIGPKMFEEFVKPEIAASCERLVDAMYHLDGPGQLDKLDSLLSIEQLAGIQWQPGAGQPHPIEWTEVNHKILDAGKKVQLVREDNIFMPLEEIDAFMEKFEGGRGICAAAMVPISEKAKAVELLEKYRVL